MERYLQSCQGLYPRTTIIPIIPSLVNIGPSSEATRLCLGKWTCGNPSRLDYLNIEVHLFQTLSPLWFRSDCEQVVSLWLIPVSARPRHLASEYSNQQRRGSPLRPDGRSDVPWLQAHSFEVIQLRGRVWGIVYELDGKEGGARKGQVSKNYLS